MYLQIISRKNTNISQFYSGYIVGQECNNHRKLFALWQNGEGRCVASSRLSIAQSTGSGHGSRWSGSATGTTALQYCITPNGKPPPLAGRLEKALPFRR